MPSLRSHSTETVLLKVTSDALLAADQDTLILFGQARSQRGFRLCGSRYPLESAWKIIRFLRDGNQMDSVPASLAGDNTFVFKLCVLAFRYQQGSTCTSYLADYFYPGWYNWRTVKSTISWYRPVVCSAHQDSDNRPTGIRSYRHSYYYPTAWNILSVDLRDPNLNLSCFRKKLKTHLFKISSTLWGFSTSNCDCALIAAYSYEKHLIIIT
jgi:hypothetical protein